MISYRIHQHSWGLSMFTLLHLKFIRHQLKPNLGNVLRGYVTLCQHHAHAWGSQEQTTISYSLVSHNNLGSHFSYCLLFHKLGNIVRI